MSSENQQHNKHDIKEEKKRQATKTENISQIPDT